MTKILLVEDDSALREIYGTRLIAEGYDVVTAGDGEAALAMAIKEQPDLILSDIMMPKVSGFEMIDILKSTTETKNIKIIVMTALSNESQRERGESLGVDRYLVKSQVGIEDVVNTVHELLGDEGAVTPTPVAQQPVTQQQEPSTPIASQPVPAESTERAPVYLNEQGMIDQGNLDLSGAGKKVIQPLDPNLTLNEEKAPGLPPISELNEAPQQIAQPEPIEQPTPVALNPDLVQTPAAPLQEAMPPAAGLDMAAEVAPQPIAPEQPAVATAPVINPVQAPAATPNGIESTPLPPPPPAPYPPSDTPNVQPAESASL